MKQNPIQFAVMREDSRLECDLVRPYSIKRILTIGSGGCTALNQVANFQDVEITVLDPNEAQLDLIRRKVEALSKFKNTAKFKATFNIENQDPNGLSQCGNFESLFRSLRLFLNEFVAGSDEWERFFLGKAPRDFLNRVFSNRYWPAAFTLFFSDGFLRAMFGPAAVQNGDPGSYPLYFQKLLEHGLKSRSAFNNYFLHHIFLGKYLDREEALPDFLRLRPKRVNFKYVHSTFNTKVRLKDFDLINVSNIFDWIDRDEITELFRHIKRDSRRGAVILWRQLNNSSDFKPLFLPGFTFDERREDRELKRDRSLFYCKICIGYKVE